MNEEEIREEIREENPGKRKKWIIPVLLLLVIAAGGACLGIVLFLLPFKGYEDYIVQKEQYFVEYSEQYDYWDVITVEYPRLEGIGEEEQEKLNQLMYDTAMDRVNYWHLEPSDEVKAFQEEHFSIFCSDVSCDVTYHSQYLVSLDYYELYAPGNPVWMTNGTERTLTVDLVTGEPYDLFDIFNVDRDFIVLWDKSLSDDTEEDYADDESIDRMLSWFLQQDEEVNQLYTCRPFYYITEEKDFVIGISFDPVLEYAITQVPTGRIYFTQLSMEELESFKKQSEFWNKYEKSKEAGEVLPCEDKKENIWLGEDAGIWEYDYNY